MLFLFVCFFQLMSASMLQGSSKRQQNFCFWEGLLSDFFIVGRMEQRKTWRDLDWAICSHTEKNTLLHFKSIFWLFKHWIPSMSSLVMKPMEIVLLCFSPINTWWFDCSYWYIYFIVSELSSFYTLRQWLAFKGINRFQEFLLKSQREQSPIKFQSLSLLVIAFAFFVLPSEFMHSFCLF